MVVAVMLDLRVHAQCANHHVATGQFIAGKSWPVHLAAPQDKVLARPVFSQKANITHTRTQFSRVNTIVIALH